MSAEALEHELDALLGESIDSVRARQAGALDQLLGGVGHPFALFGAGNLGRKVQALMKGQGLVPLAFIDNNPALWGTSIDGIEVLSPQQLAARHDGELPGIITTIWYGEASDSMAQRLEPLRRLGFNKIALFGHLAWRFPQGFLPHYCLDLPEKVLADAEGVRQAFRLLADEESRRLFVAHVRWRLFLDYDVLPAASPRQIYFDGHFTTFREDEVLYDLGAFDGDTAQGYLDSGRGYREVHCFEPVADNFSRLRARLADLHRSGLNAHRLALGDVAGEVLIEADHGPSSRVGHGEQSVPMTTLDDFAAAHAPASFIKIDIEGFEPQCLAGGRRLISERHPVIAVSVYHEQDHLWRILLQLHSYHDGYRFSLCPHVSDGWDLVLYAVPTDRVPPHSSDEQ